MIAPGSDPGVKQILSPSPQERGLSLTPLSTGLTAFEARASIRTSWPKAEEADEEKDVDVQREAETTKTWRVWVREAVAAYFIMTGAHPVFGFLGVSLPSWEIPFPYVSLQPDTSSWGIALFPAVEYKALMLPIWPTGENQKNRVKRSRLTG